MKAEAFDNGVPGLSSTAYLEISVTNINDHDPVFDSRIYNFSIPENSPAGTVVGTIHAVDNDTDLFGKVEYSLVGDYSTIFEINPETGLITVRNSSALDRELEPELFITGVTNDLAPLTSRRSTTTQIRIQLLDENDSPPIFVQRLYYASVAENAALSPPAAILQVSAVDMDIDDAGTLKYTIKSGNRNETFALDPDSGIIYPRKSLIGQRGQFSIEIEARDDLGQGPNADHAEIIIEIHQINQNRPIFIVPEVNNFTMEISKEDAVEDHLVLTVIAEDSDEGDNGRISYFFQVNSENVGETSEFKINEVTGEIRLKRSHTEIEGNTFELILVSLDHGTPQPFDTLRFLTVHFVNLNESLPQFEESVVKFVTPENGPRDVRIGKVQASIVDSKMLPIFYYILHGNEEGSFYIDKSTGDIFTNKSLDRELRESYEIYILASKKSDLTVGPTEFSHLPSVLKDTPTNKSILLCRIGVIDLNDNMPEFSENDYYAG